MAKYSTGGGGGGNDGGACELCGRETSNLRRANVAGADLLVCSDCAPHGANRHRNAKKRDRGRQGNGANDQSNPKKRAAQRAARVYDASRGDSKRWEEGGTNYERDRLPYLVSDYDERVAAARQERGITVAELAAELDAEESDVLAVEQGRATRAGVGGSLVRALEGHLEVELVDE